MPISARFVILLSILSASASTQTVTDTTGPAVKLGDRGLSGRIAPLHLINLFDMEGTKILAEDELVLPFSMERTCDPCHDYERISRGWHFNGDDGTQDSGRPGQPWIYADSSLGIQLPLSYRDWPGVMMPNSLGLSRWEFLKRFGGLMPGGMQDDVHADPSNFQPEWFTSGEPEVNCLACHNRSFRQDPAEYHMQMQMGNYAWAATAASELAQVTGSTANLPPLYDPFLPGPVDEPNQNPPEVNYHPGVFDTRSKVLMDISRQIPNERCYACHAALVENRATGNFEMLAEDVHIVAGLKCVDCHVNDLDHQMLRGAEGEFVDEHWSSCRGCHLGDDRGGSLPGYLGAPEPEHTGLPASHLERLSCTACHSGPYPGPGAQRVKTARAHALSTHAVDPSATALPAITGPVFAPGIDGKITPHWYIWPAFWGIMDGTEVVPLDLQAVEDLWIRLAESDSTLGVRSWPQDSTDVIRALAAFSSELDSGDPVYISRGSLSRLRDGKLEQVAHPASDPYGWPIAHATRPARQSLGAGGCRDCHAAAASFFNGIVSASSPGYDNPASVMSEFIGSNRAYLGLLNWIIILRPVNKILLILGTVLVAGIVLLAALKALDWYLHQFAPNPGDSDRRS
jgi:hypothetical protein